MEKLRVLLVTIFILGISVSTNGQIRKSVRGNHNVRTKERNAKSFTGIQVSSGIDVYLKQGDREKISVEADENLHEYILTEVVGDILKVYTDVNIRDAEIKRVYVTIVDVDYVKTSSAGDVYGETAIKSERIDLSASSAGDIKLEIYAKEIAIKISSSGDITLSGETDMLKVDLSSAGDLNAYNLLAKEANVSVSSAGDADINVSEKLTARASSAGNINYKGNPKNVDAHSSSAGSITRR